MPKINSLVFIDFETGGLDPVKNAVTEVAAIAIKLDTLEKIDMVSEFIKPYGEYTYEEEALKATGITQADIEGGLDVKEVVNMLLNLFKRADLYTNKGALRPIMVAHNSSFDKKFLQQIFHHCKKLDDLAKCTYGEKDFFGNYSPEFLDSITLSKLMYGADEDMVKYNLQSCITRAGVELNDAHRAINDTIALKDMVCSFIRKMRAEGSDITGEIKTTKFREHFQF